jgi:hypothetical protein
MKFECAWMMWKDNAFAWPVGAVANSSMFEADSNTREISIDTVANTESLK